MDVFPMTCMLKCIIKVHFESPILLASHKGLRRCIYLILAMYICFYHILHSHTLKQWNPPQSPHQAATSMCCYVVISYNWPSKSAGGFVCCLWLIIMIIIRSGVNPDVFLAFLTKCAEKHRWQSWLYYSILKTADWLIASVIAPGICKRNALHFLFWVRWDWSEVSMSSLHACGHTNNFKMNDVFYYLMKYISGYHSVDMCINEIILVFWRKILSYIWFPW